ncbi:MAG: SDR family oxidoreductase [Alphaproteobacteria bacterium]|nr:SDR family oxidoreductase [Alphaproteobacteria bacterium]MBL6938687.1 SDR family oxidoreductase [Alphaproteobacteria bacterium]MBL7097956.1 SDR family oxidoreductase [Alphaproteobacteria bacterium]
MKQVLVAGASGLVGRGAIRAFADDRDCEVIAVSRRPPEGVGPVRHLAVDLFDPRACDAAFAPLTGVTHLVFTALYEKENGLLASWLDPEQIDGNAAMLRNLFEPLSRTARNLKHVTLMQGTKAYGAHVRQIPVPAREDRDELKTQPNFYWNQEDYLRERQRGAAWTFSIIRPQVIFGDALGAAMNPVAALGLYGALLKERGESLHFPGGVSNVFEGVDADLVGRVIRWAGEAPAARNQAFNVTNGDVMTWHGVWPAIADALGMTPGGDRPARLSQLLPARAAEWDAIRRKYGLAAPDLATFAGQSLDYVDLLMAGDRVRMPALVSTVKLRQAGFTETMDSEGMLRTAISAMQVRRLLPPRTIS